MLRTAGKIRGNIENPVAEDRVEHDLAARRDKETRIGRTPVAQESDQDNQVENQIGDIQDLPLERRRHPIVTREPGHVDEMDDRPVAIADADEPEYVLQVNIQVHLPTSYNNVTSTAVPSRSCGVRRSESNGPAVSRKGAGCKHPQIGLDV